MAKVSVIVPVYNVCNYLKKCIDSVLNQTMQDVQLIIVNDGSTDDSALIIDNYCKIHKNIDAIHKNNEGVTLARETGLSFAKGEYILFLDGDDYLEKKALQILYEKAKSINADWVVGDYLLRYPDGRVIKKRFLDFGIVDNIGFLKYCYSHCDFYFTGRLIRRELINQNKFTIPINITYGEDNIAVTQLATQIQKATKVNSFVLNYVQRSTSVTNKLKEENLKMRSFACKICYDFLVKQNYYYSIKKEVDFYFQNELAAFLIRGYFNNNCRYLLNHCDSPYKKIIIKKRLLLGLAHIHPLLSIKLYKLLRLFATVKPS